MKILTLRALLCLSLVALIVAACGGGEQAAPTATRGPVAPTAGTSAAPTATRPAQATTAPAATVAPAATATAVPVPTGQLRLALEGIVGYSLLPGIVLYRAHLDPLYDTLVGLDLNGELSNKNGMASAWEASADGMKWTFKTRDGVTFHTGEKATAKDVKHSLDFYGGPDSQVTAGLSATRQRIIGAVESPDDSTVAVTLKTFDLFFVLKFLSIGGQGTSTGYLLPKAYMESKGRDFAIKNPVGSGPYKYKSDVLNQQLLLEADSKAHWYYGTPKYRAFDLVIVPEGTTRVAMLKGGQAEAVNVPRNTVQEMKRAGFDVASSTDSKHAFANFIDQFKTYGGSNPLANVRVRQALTLAIDLQLINEKFVYGVGVPTAVSLAPKDPAFKSYKAPAIPKQDLVLAKKLLSEAGYANGFTLLMYNFTPGLPGLSESPEIMEAIAVWWEGLGLKVERKPLDITTFLTLNSQHNFAGPTVAGIYYPATFPTTAGGPIIPQLTRNHEDVELDAASQAIANAKSLNDYIAAVQKFTDLSHSKYISIPLFYAGDSFALKSGTGGAAWNLGKGNYSFNFNQLLTGKA